MKYFGKRLLAAVLAVVFVLSLQTGTTLNAQAAGAPPQGSACTPEEWEVLRLVNERRYDAGLLPLTSVEKLQQATDIRAKELMTRFDHMRPDGSYCFTVLEEVGMQGNGVAGENIAAGYSGAEAVMEAWMSSEGHKGNILDAGFAHLGVGYEVTSKDYRYYWVQMFYGSDDCTYSDFRLILPNAKLTPGAEIGDLGIVGVLTCEQCGTCYLPVLSRYCTGYDPNYTGTQTVTVSCFGLTATFQLTGGGHVQETDPEDEWNPYRDIRKGAWYYDGVKFATVNGLFNGMEGGKFSPEGTMTRGMLVTVLHRLAGKPEAAGTENPFRDVDLKRYYGSAVLWASEKALVNGRGNGIFDPEGTITRQDMATILYRYAQLQGYDTAVSGSLKEFPDAEKVSGYAVDALGWAVGLGLINGVKDGATSALAPRANSTRAQVATVFMRFVEKFV